MTNFILFFFFFIWSKIFAFYSFFLPSLDGPADDLSRAVLMILLSSILCTHSTSFSCSTPRNRLCPSCTYFWFFHIFHYQIKYLHRNILSTKFTSFHIFDDGLLRLEKYLFEIKNCLTEIANMFSIRIYFAFKITNLIYALKIIYCFLIHGFYVVFVCNEIYFELNYSQSIIKPIIWDENLKINSCSSGWKILRQLYIFVAKILRNFIVFFCNNKIRIVFLYSFFTEILLAIIKNK